MYDAIAVGKGFRVVSRNAGALCACADLEEAEQIAERKKQRRILVSVTTRARYYVLEGATAEAAIKKALAEVIEEMP